MGFIDCDSHVVESTDTWEYFDPSELDYRPIPLHVTAPTTRGVGTPFRDVWVINDAWTGVFPEDAVARGNGNRYDPDAILMRNPSLRIEELDALGIDVQMLYGTLFLSIEIRNPIAEAAIKRSWNRWVADRVADTGGRFVWTVEAPTRMLDRAIEEIEFGKAHGAAGVHLHAVENHCYLDDPYFTPLFERMQDLDLTVVIHLGRPTTQSGAVFPIGTQFPTFAPFVEHLAAPMTAFWTVLVSDLHKRFPRLRFCISEAGATWAHVLLQQYRRTMASTADFKIRPVDPAIIEEKNLFIACQADEGLDALTSLLGENVLTIGTDYAHNDGSSQLLAHTVIVQRDDISPAVARKIVDTNGRRAFAIDPTFRPTDSIGLDAGATPLPHTKALQPELAGAAGVVGVGG